MFKKTLSRPAEKISSDFCICMTTTSDQIAAHHIAHELLQQNLVACVNIVNGVESLYHWEGKIMEEKEWILLLKSRSELIGQVKHKLLEIHPYDVPEFVVLPIKDGSEDYLQWLGANLK